MDVALASPGRAVRVGKVLVEVSAEVAAPDQMPAEAAMGKRDDVDRLVGEEGQRDDEGLVALAAGDGAADEALAKEIEDAVVGHPGEMHPGVDAQQGFSRGTLEVGAAQIAGRQNRGRRRKVHELGGGR